ncbi:MAG: hypothetical protein P8Z70_04280, partial [Desulfuromonadales bacterium]
TYIPLNPIEAYGPPSPGTPVMRPDWYFLPIYGFLKLVPGDLSISIAGGKITPETIGGVIFPGFLGLVLVAIPFLDRAKEPQNYIENPLHRPFMTSFGIGVAAFLAMTTVAGYIDVLHIAPSAMVLYDLLVTMGVWVVAYLLLRLYNRKGKRGNHVEN